MCYIQCIIYKPDIAVQSNMYIHIYIHKASIFQAMNTDLGETVHKLIRSAKNIHWHHINLEFLISNYTELHFVVIFDNY